MEDYEMEESDDRLSFGPPHSILKILTCGQLTQCLKLCSSIRKLSITGCNIENVGSPPAWNQLKSLKIFSVWFCERSIDQILLGTTQLEVFELRVLESNENLNIRSTTFKKLKIKKYMFSGDELSLDKVLRICCPNVETLEISGMFCKCLVRDMSYLTLGFNDPYDECENELFGETLREILPTIQHVEKLTLSAWCVEVLCAFQKKHLPSSLPNVKILKLYVDNIEPSCMNENLKMLVVIEDHDMFDPIAQNTDEIDDGSSEDNAETMSFGRNVSKSLCKSFLNIMEFETFHSKSFLLQLKTIEILQNCWRILQHLG